MSTNQPAVDVSTSQSHPKGFYFFFWGEFAERCSYYGMRAILFLYMTEQLKIDKSDASSIYFLFKMACYFLPLLGGYLADRFFGKYWMIVGFSIPYIIGQSLLCYEDKSFLFMALVLLAMGSGVIKPNISSLLGLTYDQQRRGNLTLRAKAFLWFYFSINVGALISMFCLPLIRDRYGYSIAFAFPAVLMFMALLVFALGKPFYGIDKPGPAPALPPEEKQEQSKVIRSLLGVFILIVLFWIPYEHNDTQWVHFADNHMDLTIPSWIRGIIGKDCPQALRGDAFQWVNSAAVLILLVFFQWFWGKFDPNNRISPIRKMSVGFLLTAMAPMIMTICAYYSDTWKFSFWWLAAAYFLLTLGEVLVYGTGLDFSYGQAPASMKSMITACFLATNGIANFINAGWARVYDSDVTQMFRFGTPGPNAVEPNVWHVLPYQFFGIDSLLPLFSALAILYVGKKFHDEHLNNVHK